MPLGADIAEEYGISERDREIFELYLEGHTQQEIAEKFGMTQQAVSKIIRAVADKLPSETIEEARNLDLVRIERMIQFALERYLAGDVQHGRLALELMKRRARVFGYDAPKGVQLEGGVKLRYEIVGWDPEKLL